MVAMFGSIDIIMNIHEGMDGSLNMIISTGEHYGNGLIMILNYLILISVLSPITKNQNTKHYLISSSFSLSIIHMFS